MNKSEAVVHMPAWLHARYIAVAEELEQMHGAAFAAAFLNDIGVAPSQEPRPSVVWFYWKRRLDVRQRTDNANCV